jgi:hypothetical protein
MSGTWTDDQAGLLQYCLHNIFLSFHHIDRYKSQKYFLATPFDQGYRFFDIEGNSLEEMVFKATEILKNKDFDRLNLETVDGLPILSIHLEVGPTVVINDILTEKTICNILL